MLFRGQNMLGYRHYADDAVAYFVQKSVANGIDILRISPQGENTLEIVNLFRKAIDGLVPPLKALHDALPLLPDEPCNGFWHGRPGVEQYVSS